MPTPNVERDETWRPAGVPVSSTMRIEASGKVANVARESLDTIDRVHGVGFSSHITIPVVEGGSSTRYNGDEMAEVSKTLSFEDAVAEIMQRVACTESEARFIAAVEREEIDGDCIELDDRGREIKPKSDSRRAA